MFRRTFWAVALVVCLLPLVAPTPLLDPDEGLHAAIAQEMVLRGDYVTPTFLGTPFLDKPILFFWTEALSLRVFGMRAAAVRLPPVVFAFLGMLALVLLARAMFDETTGYIAGIVYGTMLLPAALSNLAVHDIGLTPFLCAAALNLWRCGTDANDGRLNARRAMGRGVVVGLCFGLSILTKGLVGVVFAVIFAAGVAVVRRWAIPRLVVVLAVGGVIGLVVAAPWYAAMEHAHPGYLRYYFIERHLRGYLTATQRHALRPWWYYLPVVVVGALPWIGFVVAAGWRFAQGLLRRNTPGDAVSVTWIWFIVGLIFLSIGESKLVTYALPAMPALAMAAAPFVASGDRRWSGWRAASVLHGVAAAVLPLLVLTTIALAFAPVPAWLWTMAVCVGVIGVIVAKAAYKAVDPAVQVQRLAIATLAGATFVMVLAAPYGGRWMTGRDLAGALNRADSLPPRVGIYDERVGSVVFYLSPALRGQLTAERLSDTPMRELIERVPVDPPDAILAIRDSRADRLTRLFKRPTEPDARAGTFLIFRNDTLRRALQ